MLSMEVNMEDTEVSVQCDIGSLWADDNEDEEKRAKFLFMAFCGPEAVTFVWMCVRV